MLSAFVPALVAAVRCRDLFVAKLTSCKLHLISVQHLLRASICFVESALGLPGASQDASVRSEVALFYL